LRWSFQDPVEAGRHPLEVVIIIVVFIRGVLLRHPVTPRLGLTLLEHLTLEVLPLLLLLYVLHRFVLLSRDTPFS
jgi:hypothetical protein